MPDSDLSFAAFAGERDDRDLVFYSLSSCLVCQKADTYLKERGYAFRVIYVDTLQDDRRARLRADLSRRHGTRIAFPALVIDGNQLVLGFFPRAWNEALGHE